jgi:hypothetical protein
MEVIAAKVPFIEAFGKRKCHQSCQSQTQEKITGLEAGQDTCWDCTNLELAFLFVIIFSLYVVGWKGEERRRQIGGEYGAWWEPG